MLASLESISGFFLLCDVFDLWFLFGLFWDRPVFSVRMFLASKTTNTTEVSASAKLIKIVIGNLVFVFVNPTHDLMSLRHIQLAL